MNNNDSSVVAENQAQNGENPKPEVLALGTMSNLLKELSCIETIESMKNHPRNDPLLNRLLTRISPEELRVLRVPMELAVESILTEIERNVADRASARNRRDAIALKLHQHPYTEGFRQSNQTKAETIIRQLLGIGDEGQQIGDGGNVPMLGTFEFGCLVDRLVSLQILIQDNSVARKGLEGLISTMDTAIDAQTNTIQSLCNQLNSMRIEQVEPPS